MTTYIQVQITFPTLESAQQTAEQLVENRLAACAQILNPIRSIYLWKEKREINNEILLLVKTKYVLFNQLAETVRQGHPYDCPQIIALPILAGNENYLHWLNEQTCQPIN